MSVPESQSKLGLALSGGGFRAAFFHIGVLAQMARLGLLRHVEVISTVSGGSIIGALYYLHVMRLFAQFPDGRIPDKEFIAAVLQIERDFLKGVQTNLRWRTFGNVIKNFQMRRPDFSRSDRIGELYDKVFYRPVLATAHGGMIQMRDLQIQPPAQSPIVAEEGNLPPVSKVPLLVINATSLNTGHNWRFTPRTMGEPPHRDPLQKEVDKNWRLRRPPSYGGMTYSADRKSYPEGQSDFPLGIAVAASAGVPGIFPPVAVSDMYARGVRVQLVDGGVHDNQGLEGLEDEGCNLFIISDASGQLKDNEAPEPRLMSVTGRTNEILMDRVREEQIYRLMEKYGKDNVALIHLRKGLSCRSIPWLDADGRPCGPDQDDRNPGDTSRKFGVAESVQDLLSRVRTDLDSFTQVEAYSLMADGYLMSGAELPELLNEFPAPAAPGTRAEEPWSFEAAHRWLNDPFPALTHQLEVASKTALKVFFLSPMTAGVTALLAGLLLWFAIPWSAVRDYLTVAQPRWRTLLPLVLLAMGFAIPLLGRIHRVLEPWIGGYVRWIINALILPIAGALFVQVYLRTLDRIFLKLGEFGRLRQPRQPRPAGS